MFDSRLVSIYIDRFVNSPVIWGKQYKKANQAPYACQKPDMNTCNGYFSYEPVTENLVQRMLAGEVSCAWAAVDDKVCSKWLSFDSDQNNDDLDRLDAFLKGCGVSTIREGKRLGRAGHLWILFDEPVPAQSLITLGNAMLKFANVRLKSHGERDGVERFPVSAKGYSQLRAPLSINLKPEANGARGWFDDVEHDIRQQLLWLAEQPLNSGADALREASIHTPESRSLIVPSSIRRAHPFFKGGFKILNFVEARRCGNQLVAQCPLCAIEGHDAHQDNLRIKLDGSSFCCAYGGPNQVHKVADIVDSLMRIGPRHVERFEHCH